MDYFYFYFTYVVWCPERVRYLGHFSFFLKRCWGYSVLFNTDSYWLSNDCTLKIIYINLNYECFLNSVLFVIDWICFSSSWHLPGWCCLNVVFFLPLYPHFVHPGCHLCFSVQQHLFHHFIYKKKKKINYSRKWESKRNWMNI